MQSQRSELGPVIAERRFNLHDQGGTERSITVRLGCPFRTTLDGNDSADSLPLWRCPIQVLGLDRDNQVSAPAGEDAFVALQYAIDLIGEFINNGVERLQLVDRSRLAPDQETSWIKRFIS